MILLVRFLLVGLCVMQGACSSETYLANSSTSTFDRYSPVGSRQVSRDQQLVLASHYHIQIGYAAEGRSSKEVADLNLSARDSLARYLKRYFSHVQVANEPQSLPLALQNARSAGAQLLLYPRIENWPNIEPIRVQECEDADGNRKTSLGACEQTSESQSAELVLSVGIYDVLSGQHLDSIQARSERGMAAYFYKNNQQELDELSQMIVMRLNASGGRY
ncbi:MAG: DUF4823 domain-containing protein [Pseudomonadota bacterium]|nr:DUF4823 domain-containing protein [Pseudomonadota bacterium]